MKETPLLMRGELVRKTIAGLKTQTRRGASPKVQARITSYFAALPNREETLQQLLQTPALLSLCPYGQPGDYLWVRESWSHWVAANGKPIWPFAYRADGEPGRHPFDDPYCRWKPSIHMPRSACRLGLKIQEIRLQRLRAITEDEAIAEGATRGIYGEDEEGPHLRSVDDEQDETFASHLQGFRFLWDCINADRGFGWASNPWVWAITYKKL